VTEHWSPLSGWEHLYEPNLAFPVEVDDDPATVYRFYSQGGTLLYVGVADNPRDRFKTHASEKPWWRDVQRKTVVIHRSRMTAEIAEGKAIRSESPLYNLSPGRRDPTDPKPASRKSQRPAQPVLPSRKTREPMLISWSPDLREHIDRYAKEHGLKFEVAVGTLISKGVVQAAEEDLAAMKADLEARKAGLPLQPGLNPRITAATGEVREVTAG
jgi:hypothetical protein